MRGGFVACLGADRPPVERAAERLRWHRGRPERDDCGALQVARLVDGSEGPAREARGGVTRLVHGAPPAPLAHLERTAGRFAGLEWDGTRLRASRDPLGQAPLFYRALPGAVWLATEVEPLVSLGEPAPDLEALAARAAFVPIEERTGWSGIHRVLPGGAIEVDARELRIATGAYWEPARWLGSYRGGREEARAEFREHFSAAMRRCVEGPTGVLLSGGLDSGAVALAAPGAGCDRPHLVHVRFPGMPETREDGHASAVARELGVPLHEVDGDTSPWSPDADLDRLGIPYNWFPYGIDEPALSHLAAHGIPAALDGHDGDGVLGPPGGEWAQLLLEGALGAFASFARAYGARRAVRGTAAGLVPPGLRPRALRPRTYAQDVARYFHGALRARILREDVNRWRRPGARWRVRQLQPLLPRATVSMEQKELEAARHGIDLRHPFADRALVEFLASLPCAVKGDPGRPKSLLRDALEDVLPPALRERGKGDYQGVLRRRVDAARCIEGIRASDVRLPGLDYRRLLDDAARDPEALPLFLVVTLARAHAFARRAA